MPFDLQAFKTAYAADPKKATEEFWATYNKDEWCLWSMVYDYAEDNESLDETVAFVQTFMKNSESIKDQCFGVMHVMGKLEIQGVWLFQGSDPEHLFGSNEDTSWFTWEAIGPADTVQDKVTKVWAADKDVGGKEVKHKAVSA